MENKNVKFTVDGIGEIEISIIQTGETWWCKEIENFATHSQQRFSVMAMTKPELKYKETFQSLLQKFITFIQRGGEPQSSNLICNHFNNWLNKQNGFNSTQRGFTPERSNVCGTDVIRPDKTYEGIL
jgi:hypothetical protein